MMRCPDCKSDDVIPWDDGWLCCECGTEFDEVVPGETEENYY